MDLQELSKKWHDLAVNIQNDIDSTFFEMSDDFVKANQNALLRGELSTGDKMFPLQNEFYIDYKIDIKNSKAAMMSPPRPDLKDKGDFFRSMKSKTDNNNIINYATDSKTGKLERIYSVDIHGIQQRELPELRKTFLLIFNQRIDAKLL